MRTSLNEIRTIEAYLEGRLSVDELILFEKQLGVDATLRLNVFLQRKVYGLLKLYRRRQLKAKAQTVHDKCFNEGSDFQTSVLQIFKS